MSVYIHIPFCDNICSYCDFAKFYYNESWVDKYLCALESEIKSNYKNEVINTIYIGGGTPSSLNIEQLKKLFEIIKIFNVSDDLEFTFECNVNLSLDKIKLLKDNNVNRISIGIESVLEKKLKILNRNHTKEKVIKLIKLLKEYNFNINCDLIYAVPGEDLKDLESDLDFLIDLDINHISTYSLIIEPHTKLYINNTKNIDEDLDCEMYEFINKKLSGNGFVHYEVSNFAKNNYQSKHNLVYWNNECYYGFGIGASGYVNNIRYDNTKSFNEYINGNYILNKNKLTKEENLENEFILGLRKIEGIDINKFKNKYNIDILSIDIVNKLLKENKLEIKNNKLRINDKYIYISNSILVDFIGAFDK